jgi:hypothetical protein
MTINVMSWLRNLWQRLTTNKYVQALEAEVERLRAENRALMNSILGIAGIPPVVTQGSEGAKAASVSVPATASNTAAKTTAPLRRRSWQQINKALEVEAARKKEPETKSNG